MVICTEPIVLVLCTSVLCWFQRDLGKKKSVGFVYEFLSLSQEVFFCLTRSQKLLHLELRCLRVLLEYAVQRKLEVSPEALKERDFSDLLQQKAFQSLVVALAGPLQRGLFFLVVGSVPGVWLIPRRAVAALMGGCEATSDPLL